MFRPVRLPRIDTTPPLSENCGGFLAQFHRSGNAMRLRPLLNTLLALALALPIIQCVLIWVRGLLLSMGDQEGAAIIGHVGTGCLVVWAIGLVGLVIVLAIVVAGERPPGDDAGS